MMVIMPVEGVLTEERPGVELLHYESSNPGKVLFTMVRDSSQLLLLATDQSKDKVRAWLARERLHRYSDVHCMPGDTPLAPWAWRVSHIEKLLAAGHHIDFVIDHKPEVIRACLNLGIDGLLFTPTGLPGAGIGPPDSVRAPGDMPYRPWYDLVESIEQQEMLRATRELEVTSES